MVEQYLWSFPGYLLDLTRMLLPDIRRFIAVKLHKTKTVISGDVVEQYLRSLAGDLETSPPLSAGQISPGQSAIVRYIMEPAKINIKWSVANLPLNL